MSQSLQQLQVPSPLSISRDSKGSLSAQTLSYTRMTRGVRARSIHEQLHELALSTIYCLLAALMQCLSLASLCVAISLLKWVVVTQSPFAKQPKRWVSYNFGVPEEMEAYDVENISFIDTQKIRFFVDRPNFFVPAITAICFLSTCFGFGAFLLDFIEVEKLGRHQLVVVTSLHALTGLFIGTLIVTCCCCFVTLSKRVHDPDLKKYDLSISLGESTFITLVSFGFIIFAIVLSWHSMQLSKKEREQRESTEAET